MFTERAPTVTSEPTRDERKVTAFEQITADHVLASAADSAAISDAPHR